MMKYLTTLITVFGLATAATAYADQGDPHAQHKAGQEAMTEQPAGAADVQVPLPGTLAKSAEAEAAAEERARKFFTDLEVVDQNGRRLRFYSDVLKDRVVLINFIYTNCPDACPLITQKLKQIRSLLVPAVTDDIWFISMSTDPERDTPEAMKEFARKQGVDESRWLFITGSKENITHLIKKLGQYTENVESHSTLMLAGNTRTKHWKRVMPMVQPPGVAAQLRDLAEEKSG